MNTIKDRPFAEARTIGMKLKLMLSTRCARASIAARLADARNRLATLVHPLIQRAVPLSSPLYPPKKITLIPMAKHR